MEIAMSERSAQDGHVAGWPTYSVMIKGDLGPLLQSTFGDFNRVLFATSTVFFIQVPSGGRLAEITHMLNEKGMELMDIRRVSKP
jgi:hypothetical protein